MVVLLILSVVMIAGGLYMIFFRDISPPKHGQTPLASVKNAIMYPPGNLYGYTKGNSLLATVQNYASADGRCNLRFGTLSSNDLPGKNNDEIIANLMKGLVEQTGAPVKGPTPGSELRIRNANPENDFDYYTMPTVFYSVTGATFKAKIYYSVAILQSGERAIVSRSCQHADGSEVTDTEIQLTNDLAKKISASSFDQNE